MNKILLGSIAILIVICILLIYDSYIFCYFANGAYVSTPEFAAEAGADDIILYNNGGSFRMIITSGDNIKEVEFETNLSRLKLLGIGLKKSGTISITSDSDILPETAQYEIDMETGQLRIFDDETVYIDANRFYA